MEVIILAAITADGFIARSPDDRSFDWNSAEDKQFYVQTIKSADAVVMSSKSFRIIKKFPRGLTFAVYTRKPDDFKNHRPDVIKAFPTQDSPQQLIQKLQKSGFKKIVIAGGSSIFNLFLKAGVVNQLFLTVEPILFGQGVNLLNQLVNIKLKLVKCTHLSLRTILLEYDVLN
ncbi:hypothetical protein AUK18_00190 [Candidatus Beckwithbacteria bacterium CG2_30_44_31]|uniref:Bacterial bifunctional deaminase-reductase C-terminal domain-containing protein n=1 Tax=Candidatus Beckwithbacteria bacterium CG2_30_44_31 TaxID=1805035 RepID=A0A1J5AZ93_9BACT|nr:MAG: hypothetical protein AUK18_00190 [Candidatus Beckwithbacteria bacterium CG2_30_44_31]